MYVSFNKVYAATAGYLDLSTKETENGKREILVFVRSYVPGTFVYSSCSAAASHEQDISSGDIHAHETKYGTRYMYSIRAAISTEPLTRNPKSRAQADFCSFWAHAKA